MKEQPNIESMKKIDALLRQKTDISPEFDEVLKGIPVEIAAFEIEGLDVREGYPDLEPFEGGFTAKLELTFSKMPWATRTYSFTHIPRKGVDKLLEKRDQKEGLTLHDFSGHRLVEYGPYSVIGNKQFYRYFRALPIKFPVHVGGQPALKPGKKQQEKSQS